MNRTELKRRLRAEYEEGDAPLCLAERFAYVNDAVIAPTMQQRLLIALAKEVCAEYEEAAEIEAAEEREAEEYNWSQHKKEVY